MIKCYENHGQDSRVREIEIPSINAKAGTGGGNLPLVCCSGFKPGQGSAARGIGYGEEVSPTLASEEGGNARPAIAIAENIIGRQDHNGGNGLGAQREMSYTLNATGTHGVAVRSCVRRLTTVECARLQAFPDHHTEIPWNGKPASLCPRGKQYKAYGNSMCVAVIEWLGQMIEKEIDEE